MYMFNKITVMPQLPERIRGLSITIWRVEILGLQKNTQIIKRI